MRRPKKAKGNPKPKRMTMRNSSDSLKPSENPASRKADRHGGADETRDGQVSPPKLPHAELMRNMRQRC